MVVIDSKYITPGEVPGAAVIKRCFELHGQQLERLSKLYRYLDGRQKICERQMKSSYTANNRLVCNHAEYITSMAVGYVHGSPVQYSGADKAGEVINDLFTRIDEDSHNAELATDISTYGYGLEYIYMSDDDKPEPMLATVDPRSAFVVCDSDINSPPLFGVLYSPRVTLDGSLEGHDVTICTADSLYEGFTPGRTFEGFTLAAETENPFGLVPLIEYKNNKQEKGDFEGVITLIDAYNLLQSDRVNDKEQFVDSLLAISGMSLGDSGAEASETAKLVKEMRFIELQDGGDAKWISKAMTEADVEILKQSIKNDIHEFSKVPCLTDENFANNASGVAMKYKLLGFEQLGKTKERYFKQGLRKRLQLIANVYRIKGIQIDLSAIDIVMKRNLPVDDEMLARIAQTTEGFMSWETRLQRYDAEIDPEEERERLQAEKEEAARLQQLAFGTADNEPPAGEDEQ